MAIDESDPIAAQSHTQDEPGSFLDVYRSTNRQNAERDADFVDKSVHAGVVPSSIRYGVMRRGPIEVYRGVVKAVDGSLHYFNWSEGTAFHLVKADDETKQWEAARFYKSCTLGCDMHKGPVEPGESVEDDDEDDADKGGEMPAATMAQTEEQWMASRDTAMHEVHPGAAGSQTPDDPTVGRDWHQKAISRPGDGSEIPVNDGQQHWTTAHLVKAWGQKLQETAPRLVPKTSPEEAQYLREVLGASPEQISKGLVLAPRHRVSYEKWRTSQLRGNLTNLEAWLTRNRE
jgi:hypothetical protein